METFITILTNQTKCFKEIRWWITITSLQTIQLETLMTSKVPIPIMKGLILIRKGIVVSSIIVVESKEEMLIRKWTTNDLDQQCKWEACYKMEWTWTTWITLCQWTNSVILVAFKTILLVTLPTIQLAARFQWTSNKCLC